MKKQKILALAVGFVIVAMAACGQNEKSPGAIKTALSKNGESYGSCRYTNLEGKHQICLEVLMWATKPFNGHQVSKEACRSLPSGSFRPTEGCDLSHTVGYCTARIAQHNAGEAVFATGIHVFYSPTTSEEAENLCPSRGTFSTEAPEY